MKRPISRHLVSTHPSSSTALAAEGTIACTICHAVYAPSRFHAYLLQIPAIALESAFISMCHFCYRCRRASCPNCWDHIHGVCAQCTQETHLSFRMETPPLPGTHPLPHPLDPSIQQLSASSSLVRVQPGRFQTLPTRFVESTHNQAENLPKLQAQSSIPKSAQTIAPSSHGDSECIKTRPDHNNPQDLDEIATRPDPPRVLNLDRIATRLDPPHALNLDEVTTRPDPPRGRDLDKIATRPERGRSASSDTPASPNKRLATRNAKHARLFRVLVLVFLLLIVAVIVAALLSGTVNLLLYRALHIDIQTLVTSFWHTLLNLF